MQNEHQKISLIGILIWLIPAIFFMYEFLLRTFLGSISNDIIKDLNLTIQQFTTIGSVYYISYGLMQMPVGVLVDKFGVKKILVVSSAFCAIATYFFACSDSFMMALWGRFLLGIGSSFAFVCLFVTVANWFPKKYFGFFSGLSQFVGTLGPIIAGGPLISFILHSNLSWRVALTYVGSFGIVIAIVSLIFFRNKPKSDINQSIQAANTKEIKEPIAIRLKRLCKIKQVWYIAIFAAIVYAPLSVMGAILGTSFLRTCGLSHNDAAYMISTAWIGYAIGCPLLGYLSDVMKRRKLFFIISSLFGLISTLSILYFNLNSTWSYAAMFFLLGVAGSGQNLGFPAILENSSPDIKASAIGIGVAFVILLSAVYPTIAGFFISLNDNGVTNANNISHAAYVHGLMLLPISYVISLLFSIFFCKETFCKQISK